MPIPLESRNADLNDIVLTLKVQHNAKRDAVVPADAIRSLDGVLHVTGTDDRGDDQPALYRPTAIMDGHLADKLGIPVKYLRRLRDERVDLYDLNVNRLLRGDSDAHLDPADATYPPDGRRFFFRGFADPDGGEGVARALMSDSFGRFDNLDATMAVLQGTNDTGHDVNLYAANLSETRMSLKFVAPGLQVLAPKLLENYRPPVQGGGWSVESARAAAAREGRGYTPGEEPIVFAGFQVDNSETGGSALTCAGLVTIEMCGNGLKFPMNVLRKIHLGHKLEQGVVRWSTDTQRKNVETIAAMMRDTINTFLDIDYVKMVIDQLEQKSGTELKEPVKTIERVSNELGFSEATMQGILDHFVKGGQTTAGGVMQAITSFAQTVSDVDLAWERENLAVKSLELAAA